MAGYSELAEQGHGDIPGWCVGMALVFQWGLAVWFMEDVGVSGGILVKVAIVMVGCTWIVAIEKRWRFCFKSYFK